MSAQKMVELLKGELIEVINVLNFDNFSTQIEILEKQLKIFKSIGELELIKKEALTKNVETSDTPIATEVPYPVDEEITCQTNEEPTVDLQPTMYRFERKIKGGFIPEIEAFCPEGIIRSLGLEHGDMVYATPLDKNDESPYRRYRYEIAEKGNGNDNPERVQINYCPVKKEAGRYVVDRSEETGEFIRYDESLYTVVLNEDEVREFRITEGSLIDIAFPKSKPQAAKIIWAHSIEDLPVPKTPVKKEKTIKTESEVFEQTLKGKSVLVIGNEPKKSLYKYNVNRRGGIFLWADASEKLSRLEPLVKKADVCIFLLSVSGHVGMEHIKRMCKDNGVIFSTTWSIGQTSLIRMAEEATA